MGLVLPGPRCHSSGGSDLNDGRVVTGVRTGPWWALRWEGAAPGLVHPDAQ